MDARHLGAWHGKQAKRVVVAQIALREGLRISGLMGVLVEAKRRGLLKSVRALVGRLEREVGFHISKPVKEEAFRRSGE